MKTLLEEGYGGHKRIHRLTPLRPLAQTSYRVFMFADPQRFKHNQSMRPLKFRLRERYLAPSDLVFGPKVRFGPAMPYRNACTQ